VRTLTVRVLGEFRVDELDLSALGSRKARQLLRLLALACGRSVAVGALADALWADRPPAHPADQVAVLVSRVRRQTGVDRIVRDDEGYRLRYDWLDVDELESVIAETERRRTAGNRTGAAAAARIALSLIRAEPGLAGLEGEWAVARVAALMRVIREARRVAATALLEAGQPMAAVGLLGAAIEGEPYDEQAVRQLMRAESAAGRPGAALAAFAALRERLADDLGTEPAPETAALHLAILRGEFSAVRPPALSSARESPFVGRDAELARLDELADRVGVGAPAVVTILGDAGMGKTTLVRAWRERRAAAGDTVLSGACGPLERSVPLDALIVALADHLRQLDDADVAAVLGPEAGSPPVAAS
jgi:DNA-binding SARP family transcriptional activator